MPALAPQPGPTTEQLPFVFAKHVEAIIVLMEERINTEGTHAMSQNQREESVKLLEANGWSWPLILDEPYPEITPGGLKYKRVTIGYDSSSYCQT
jgi:hypothetical protein